MTGGQGEVLANLARTGITTPRLAAATLVGALTWPRALGAAVAAGALAMRLALWRRGLMMGGPRAALGEARVQAGAAAYVSMVLWAAVYALVAGAVATAALRAAGWHR